MVWLLVDVVGKMSSISLPVRHYQAALSGDREIGGGIDVE